MHSRASLPLIEKLSFGLGDFVGNMLFGISGSYLVYFYTNIEAIPPEGTALLMFVARIIDSLADPATGLLIDRQTLFRGRVRPYIRWFGLPFAIATFLCFVPSPFLGWGKWAWIYGTYLFSGILFSLVINPYGLLPNVMTRDSSERLSLATYRMFGATLGVSLVGAIAFPLVHLFGGTNEALGFEWLMAIICVSGALLLAAPAFVCRERHHLPATRHSLAEVMRMLIRNRAWIVVTAVLSLFYLNLTAFYGLAVYYAQAVLGLHLEFGGLLISVMGAGKVAGTLFSPFIVRRLGLKAAVAGPYLLSLVGLWAFYALGARPNLLLLDFGVICLLQGMTLPVMYLMVADAISVGESQYGVSAGGMAYALNNFGGKIAWAIGGGLSASMLTWGGYIPSLPAQSLHARAFITFGFLGVPAIVAIISAIIILFYPKQPGIVERP